MHNTLLQISIGFLPALVTFVLLIFLSKKHKLRNILAGALSLTVVLVCGVFGLIENANQPETATYEKADVLQLTYAVANQGDTELASKMLDELYATEYNKEYTVFAARLAAQNGDVALARALYMKAADIMGEKELVDETNAVNMYALADKLYYSGGENGYSYSLYQELESARNNACDKAKAAVASLIDNDKDELYEKAAKYITASDELHFASLGGGVNIDEAKKQLRKFNSFLEENPGFESLSAVRIARLKMRVACEDYKGVARDIDKYSDHNELLIVSELYLRGDVKQKDFSDEFSSNISNDYEAVYQVLNEVYNNEYTDKSREERRSAAAQLKALRTIIKYPSIGLISESLIDYTEKQNSPDSSKVFLQLAKIEHSLGNTTMTSKYLDRSIDTVGDCDDADYTKPMYELVSIIADKDNSDRLKNVPEFVDEVLNNNMTIKMAEPSEDVVETRASDGEEESGSSKGGDLAGDFSGQIQTYISQKRMSIKIVSVDTSTFEKDHKVTATVNISDNLYKSASELKKALKITDCGISIDDFKVEKVDYEGANILLCVDVSGSMSDYGKIGYLKEAIKLFAEGKEKIENISLVTFSSGIEEDLPFGTSSADLIAAADSLRASGGTSIYNSLCYSIDKFKVEDGVINSIIVMSDGLDGYRANMAEIEKFIQGPCKEKGITIYSIGFGSDVDGAYLSSLASATGGAFLYADDPGNNTQTNQLSAFFEGLRAQILNQYTITFTAKNTLQYSRDLRVNVGENGLDEDVVTYYLGGGKDSITEPEYDESSPIAFDNKMVNGMYPSILFKKKDTQKTTLIGEGFKAEDNISVSIKGNTTNVEWTLAAKYINETSIEVTVPNGIGTDTYDVYVKINGKTAVLPGGFSLLVQGKEQITDFGQYRFLSYAKVQNKDKTETKLNGYVRMNGWLNFKGEITLKGKLDSNSVTLVDLLGSTVKYDKANAVGIAKLLANSGLGLYVPALGSIQIYNDAVPESNTGDIKAEIFPLNTILVGKLLKLGELRARLYPNRVEITYDAVTLDLPFAKKIIKNEDIFYFKAEGGAVISSSKIGSKLDLEYEPAGNSKKIKKINFGNLPIALSQNEFELHLDTVTNNYQIKFKVGLSFLEGFNLSMKWGTPGGDSLDQTSNGLVPTEIILGIDKDINSTIAGVPVTWSDFKLGLTNINTSLSPIYWTLQGGFDLSAVKLTAYKPLKGLEDYIGDVSIVKLDDATVSLCLGDMYLGAKADVKFLEELKFGDIEIDLGKFTYQSKLLGMSRQEVVGLRAKVGVSNGVPDEWNFKGSTIKFNASAEIDLLSRFFGVQFTGDFEAKVKVWIVKVSTGRITGGIAIGIRVTPSGKTAFVIRSAPWDIDLTWPKNMAGKV